MSSLIFPTLLGLGWNITRTYQWKTGVQTALSGKTSTVAKRAYPLVRWEIGYDVLRQPGAPGYSSAASDEVLQIVGLHNQVQGRFDTWLYKDPDFNAVPAATPSVFATVASTDTTATIYQLVAINQNTGGPGASELIQNLNTGLAAPVIYGNGVTIPSGHYTINPSGNQNGGVQFSTLPSTGTVLSWSGPFYYRCRFDNDELPDMKKLMLKIWALSKLNFTSVKL